MTGEAELPFPNRARARLAAGELALGLMINQLRTTAAPMLAHAAGFDWLFIEMEHGGMSVDDAIQMSMAALPLGLTPFVRTSKEALHDSLRVLDNGAMGIIVPHVETADEARAIVSACRYRPEGERSLSGPPAAFGYNPPAPALAMKALNEALTIVVMLETPEAIANADSIAAVEGIDILKIGGTDLSAALGVPGEAGHPLMREAFGSLAAACRRHVKVMGMGGIPDQGAAADYVAMGVRFIHTGNDHNYLLNACRARVADLRKLPTP